MGDFERARRFIASRVADQPKDTLLNRLWAPLTASIVALGENKPDVAIAALGPSEVLQRRWPEITLQRGIAYVRRGNTAAARKAYRQFLDFWKHADPDLTALVEARRELAALR